MIKTKKIHNNKKLLLCILDGWGYNKNSDYNAIYKAQSTFFDSLLLRHPNTLLNASGRHVGLPDGQIGNSEIGHSTIGAGRLLPCDLINIENIFFIQQDFSKIDGFIKNYNANIHVIGLLSDGGVHSHYKHMDAIYSYIRDNYSNSLYMHAITDGRDTAPSCTLEYFNDNTRYATISGRYYAMDRDRRWDRIQKAYNAIVLGNGTKFLNYVDCIKSNYNNGITDEFFEPAVIDGYEGIQKGDFIICVNFRPDRVIQIVSEIMSITHNCPNKISDLNFLGMNQYSDDLDYDSILKPQSITNSLGEVLSNNNYTQFRIAETEKYAHVTYFFSCKRNLEFKNEKRVLIHSPKVSTYDLCPEMSALEITNKCIKEVKENKFDFVLLNYANADMVGHTGSFDSTIKAIETLDICMQKIVKLAFEQGYTVIFTADHGNAEKMFDIDNNQIFTAHTLNPVPFIFIDPYSNHDIKLRSIGNLADVAPTILEYYGINKPAEMTGHSLFIK